MLWRRHAPSECSCFFYSLQCIRNRSQNQVSHKEGHSMRCDEWGHTAWPYRIAFWLHPECPLPGSIMRKYRYPQRGHSQIMPLAEEGRRPVSVWSIGGVILYCRWPQVLCIDHNRGIPEGDTAELRTEGWAVQNHLLWKRWWGLIRWSRNVLYPCYEKVVLCN